MGRWLFSVLAVAQIGMLWDELHSVGRWMTVVGSVACACLAHLRAVRRTALGRKLGLTEADFR